MKALPLLLVLPALLSAVPAAGQDRVLADTHDGVEARLFLPDGVETVRGLLLHVANYRFQTGNRWTELCRELEFGHLVLSMNMRRTNRPRILGQALDAVLPRLAERSGHPELVHVPIMGTGHSAGGMVVNVLAQRPQRMLTTAIDCSWVADPSRHPPELREVPMLFTLGAVPDGFNMIPAIENHFDPARRDGWLYGLGFEWGKAHSFGNAAALFVPWMKAVAERRLPEATPRGEPVVLRPMREEDGWLGDRATWDTTFPTVAPWAEFEGDRAEAVWLPSRAAAWAWRAYQVKDSPVHLTAAAGDASLGAFRPSREFQMTVPVGRAVEFGVAAGDAELAKVRYVAGDRQVGEAAAAPWSATWNAPPAGVHTVFAQYETTDGTVGVTNPGVIVVRTPTEVREVE